MSGSDLEVIAWTGVVCVLITSIILLISQSWRVSLGAFAVQYIGVLILVSLSWRFPMALTKLIVGWIATLVLWIAITNLSQPSEESQGISRDLLWATETSPLATRAGNLFRIFAAGVVILAVLSVAPKVTDWLPDIGIQAAIGAVLLLGMGLLHIGLTGLPFRIVLGLLTVISGFEIIYAAVEVSALVAGLSAGVSLALALVGAYLILVRTMGETL